MAFHELLEPLHSLNHHSNTLTLEAAPVWSHRCSPETREGKGWESKLFNHHTKLQAAKQRSGKDFLLNELPTEKFNTQKCAVSIFLAEFYALTAICAQVMFFFPTAYYLQVSLSLKMWMLKCCRWQVKIK